MVAWMLTMIFAVVALGVTGAIELGWSKGIFFLIRLMIDPLILGVLFAWYLFGRFYVFKDTYKYGFNISTAKQDEIRRSISENALKDLRPDLCETGYYIDFNSSRVAPGALLANYDDHVLYYYYEPWVSFTQRPSDSIRYAIPFSDILDVELVRGGEKVFSSSAVSSAAFGYAIGGSIGAAFYSSASRETDIINHERSKRIDLKINIITRSPIEPLVSLPLTVEGPFSNAVDETIDKVVNEILAVLYQIIELNKRTEESNALKTSVDGEASTRRRSRSNGKIAQIRELKELLDSGAISQEEYETLKDEIIKRE